MKYDVNEAVEFLYEGDEQLRKGTGIIKKIKRGGLFTSTKYLIETVQRVIHKDSFGGKHIQKTDIYVWIKEANIISSIGRVKGQL